MGLVFTSAVIFAALTAGVGAVLGVLAWEQFRGSPFGRLVGLLAVLMAVFSAYHVLLLVVGRESIPVFESAAFTGLLAYVVLMIRLHHRLARKPQSIEP